jgi:single-strand DNA-binding protein
MNLFTFTGRLGRDCEQKALPSGTAICEFAVAVTSGYGDREQTTWCRCVLFGKRAEGGLPQYLVKGQQVAISGELTNRKYQKKDGTDGWSLEVNVNTLDLIGAKEDRQQQFSPPPVSQPQPAQRPQVGGAMFPPPEDLDSDDIPF